MTVSEVLQQEEAYLPETIRMLFPSLSETELEKVFALNTILHSKQPYEDFYVFEDIVLALNGIKPDFRVMQGCTPEQIFYAFYIIGKLNKDPFYFDWEIKQWTKLMLRENGVYFYPPELDFDDEKALVSYDEIAALAQNGPFPLEEDLLGVQASHWLAIQLYIDKMILMDSWSSKEK